MKRLLTFFIIIALFCTLIPKAAHAAGGIYASGGGKTTVGGSLTVTVTASGATFNALEGTISINGPVSVSSFSAGGATWLTAPGNGVHFKGMVIGGTSSLRVATIKLKANGVGSGAVSVGSVRLANNGAEVGSGAGSASFTIEKAPDLPGTVKVSSSSHPDQNAAYDATTIVLSWNKDSGVDGFSYLLDQASGTTPAAKTTDTNTSATYADKAVGTYYFHIRAHKADGWGGTTHFKITIKEPDAKIDTNLAKPSKIEILKADNFTNDITNGTVTGIIIKGITESGFTANISLLPTPTVPEGKKMSAETDSSGEFSLLIDFPVVSGYHKLTVQGQKEKTLTPISDEIIFEISQARGGSINILTSDDAKARTAAQAVEKAKNWKDKLLQNRFTLYGLLALLLIIFAVVLPMIYIRKKKQSRG